jgi:hypothetical protein
VKDDTEEGTVDFQAPVVFNEAEGPELIHKMINPRPGCAHHLRQIFLTDFRDDLLWFTFLTEMRQQEQNAGQASLTGVEKLIHQGAPCAIDALLPLPEAQSVELCGCTLRRISILDP